MDKLNTIGIFYFTLKICFVKLSMKQNLGGIADERK